LGHGNNLNRINLIPVTVLDIEDTPEPFSGEIFSLLEKDLEDEESHFEAVTGIIKRYLRFTRV
jgi:hypothetical protein